MKKPELYKKTVDILVQAYFNDTLMHNTCYACAVGNLVAANIGCNVSMTLHNRGEWIDNKGKINRPFWSDIVKFGKPTYRDSPIGLKQIKATGYSIEDICKIELAFEKAPSGKRCFDDSEEWMFSGLMAVIDVLDEIHDNKDAAATSATKQRFQKQPQNA